MEIKFCEICGCSITDYALSQGEGVTVNGTVYCEDCKAKAPLAVMEEPVSESPAPGRPVPARMQGATGARRSRLRLKRVAPAKAGSHGATGKFARDVRSKTDVKQGKIATSAVNGTRPKPATRTSQRTSRPPKARSARAGRTSACLQTGGVAAPAMRALHAVPHKAWWIGLSAVGVILAVLGLILLQKAGRIKRQTPTDVVIDEEEDLRHADQLYLDAVRSYDEARAMTRQQEQSVAYLHAKEKLRQALNVYYEKRAQYPGEGYQYLEKRIQEITQKINAINRSSTVEGIY